MYGIVNKSIEELVTLNYGASKWELIKSKSNISTGYFISNESYDDDITYSLAGTIAEELNVPLSEVLQSFGKWWILHTGKNHYGYLLESGGENFKSFMLNLPSFHNRVMMMYPKLTPPEFQISDVEENSLHLHYMSKRKGLLDFLYGLLSGLGEFFATRVTTTHMGSLPGEHTHEIIKVSWKNQ
jgi:hypothetical protein